MVILNVTAKLMTFYRKTNKLLLYFIRKFELYQKMLRKDIDLKLLFVFKQVIIVLLVNRYCNYQYWLLYS